MSGLRYRIAYVPWWRPIRLAQHHDKGFDFIGWVWRTKARQVWNVNYGWIAFAEDQTPERLSCCPHCDRPFDETPVGGKELGRDPDSPSNRFAGEPARAVVAR